jgi:hypothetical protein
VCKKAINCVKPIITDAARNGILVRGTVHIVIVNPRLTPGAMELDTVGGWIAAGGIMHEETVRNGRIGDVEKYITIARLMAYLSWHDGRTTSEVQSPKRLYELGDSIDCGSAIIQGLVVGTNGVQPFFNDAISYMVAVSCSTICFDLAAAGAIPHRSPVCVQ